MEGSSCSMLCRLTLSWSSGIGGTGNCEGRRKRERKVKNGAKRASIREPMSAIHVLDEGGEVVDLSLVILADISCWE